MFVRALRHARRDDGVSTLELVIASALLVVLMSAILPALILGQRSVDRLGARVTTLDNARLALARMSREARAAAAVTPVDAQRVTLRTWAGGALRDVAWDCSAPGPSETFRCVRTVEGRSTVIFEGLRNRDPFRLAPNGRYLEIHLVQQPRQAKHPMILRSAVSLRGCLPNGTVIQTCTGAAP